jgi:hypothetical protein
MNKSFKEPHLSLFRLKPNLRSPIEKPIQKHCKQKKKSLAEEAVDCHFHILISFPSFG